MLPAGGRIGRFGPARKTGAGGGGGPPPSYTPALKFNDRRNSQYSGQVV